MKIYVWIIDVMCFFVWLFCSICNVGAHHSWLALINLIVAFGLLGYAYENYKSKYTWQPKLNKDVRCMIGWHRWTWKLYWDEIIYLKQIPDRAVCSRCGTKYKEDYHEEK